MCIAYSLTKKSFSNLFQLSNCLEILTQERVDGGWKIREEGNGENERQKEGGRRRILYL